MKKIFQSVLVASIILTGSSYTKVQTIKPTTNQTSSDTLKQKKVSDASVIIDDKKSASTTDEIKTISVDTIIPQALKNSTLEKFNILSQNLDAAKECNEIAKLYPMISYWDPIWTRCIREHPGKLYYCPTSETFMPNIPDLPYINASCIPNKNDCRYILTAEPYNKSTQLDYIKLLLHIKPAIIISLANDITDAEEYSDETFHITQINKENLDDIVSQCTLSIKSSTSEKNLAAIKKIYIQWPMLTNPKSSMSIAHLIKYIKDSNPTNEPIVIQSTSGNGRPSCLATMLLAYDEMTKSDESPVRNLPEILSYIAQIRCLDIYLTKEQYVLIYDVVNKLAHNLPYTPAVHSFLSHHKLDDTPDVQTTCCICLQNIAETESSIKTFPVCKHKIHKACNNDAEHCPHCCRIY